MKRGVECAFSHNLGPPAGTIHTIEGGFADGGDTQAARKGQVRTMDSVHEILFEFQHPYITISMAAFE